MNTQNPNPIALELAAMAQRLRDLFPESDSIELRAQTCSGVHFNELDLHRVGDYQAGTALLRRLGVGERSKLPYASGDGINHDWTTLVGDAGGLGVRAFCTGLPPSCRIETVTKSVPETVPTGRMVEVQERVVKCGVLT